LSLSRYDKIPPVKFREGDIVEAQFSFSLVPVKNGFYKMIAVLRRLTLLDPSFSQVRLVFVSFSCHSLSEQRPLVGEITIKLLSPRLSGTKRAKKRILALDDTAVNETGEKLQRMNVEVAGPAASQD
jgi:hypothetical protein